MAVDYDKNHQIEIVELSLTPNNGEKFSIFDLLVQMIVYEDLYQAAISANLIFMDQNNLIGELPITGGETVKIQYKTPMYHDLVSLEFKVYKIGERQIPNSNENIQVNELFLCTPEVWWAANNDIYTAFNGTYSDIVGKLINETGTKKTFDKADSIGIASYVAPSCNVFNSAQFCASRAYSQDQAPFFFWESTDGYHFKDLKTLYRAAYNKTVWIADKSASGFELDGDKAFNTLYNYEYLENNDRLRQFNQNAFGAENFFLDITNARIAKINNTYDALFHTQDIKLNKFPLNDSSSASRRKIGFIPVRSDNSHIAAYSKHAASTFMDNMKLMINIPGDSKLKVGDVVWIDLPSKSGLAIGLEKHSSGKWFTRSLKHLITKNTYSMICEMTKDSFDVEIKG